MTFRKFLVSTYGYLNYIFFGFINIMPCPVRWFFLKLVLKKMGCNVLIDYGCYIRYPWKVSIGSNVSFNRGCNIYASMQIKEAEIIIENNVALGPNVTIFGASHDYSSFTLPDIARSIIIKKYAWIGGNSTIHNGVIIGEGAVVGACSVVTKNVPPFTVVAGVPAKEISKRVMTEF